MGRKRLFNEKEKWCNKCKKWLPLDAFGENRRTASGKSHYCKTCHSAYCGTFWTKVAQYEQLLAQKFQMTPNDYLELWRQQGKRCAICECSLVLYHRDTLIRVLGDARRLLCSECNKGLDCFQSNPKFLMKACEQISRSAP